MSNKYDVVIIGAGISGLVCGCYLAKAGLKVIMVEKEANPGGCCVSFKRKHFRFDAGVHTIGNCGERGTLSKILKELNVAQSFAKLTPTDRFFFSEDIIDIPDEVKKYCLLLQKRFPKERIKIEVFFKELIKIASNIKAAQKEFGELTYQNFLDKYFDDPRLKAILSAQAGYLGMLPKNASAIGMCAMLYSYLKEGAYYPYGGAGSLAEKLAEKFESLGGSLNFNTRVTKILKTDGHVKGIVINEEREVFSDIVVSSADLTQTFYSLISDNSELLNLIRDKISNSAESMSLFITYLGVDLGTNDIESILGWHYSDYDVNNGLNSCVYIASPSVYDESAIHSRKEGIIEAFKIFPYKYDDITNWKGCKEQLEKEMISSLSEIMPKIRSAIVFKESATPKTINDYTFNRHGVPYGWALTSGQYHRNDFILEAAIKMGLYLTGHWTNPGGGVLTVAISGFMTARMVISYYERENVKQYS